MEYQHRTRASKLYTLLRSKHLRVNKSLFWALEGSQANDDVAPPAVLQTLVPSIMAIQSQLG